MQYRQLTFEPRAYVRIMRLTVLRQKQAQQIKTNEPVVDVGPSISPDTILLD